MNNRLIIPYFISMNGCKYRCIYCNQYLLKEHDVHESVEDIVKKYLNYSKKKDNIELGFYGGTFLNLPQQKIDTFLGIAEDLKRKGLINRVRISTTPDSVNEKKCNKIKGIVDIVELGVQTLDDRLLKLMRRGYTKKDCMEKTNLLKYYGFNIVYQLMLGLPLQSFQSFVDTIDIICFKKPDAVRLYPLLVLKNTPLEVYTKLKIIEYPKMKQVIKQGALALLKLYKYDIAVIRVGLTEFFEKSHIVEGFVEHNWRIQMESLLWRLFFETFVDEYGSNKLSIHCSKSDYNAIKGIKNENMNYFYEKGYVFNLECTGQIHKYKLIVNGLKCSLLDYESQILFKLVNSEVA